MGRPSLVRCAAAQLGGETGLPPMLAGSRATAALLLVALTLACSRPQASQKESAARPATAVTAPASSGNSDASGNGGASGNSNGSGSGNSGGVTAPSSTASAGPAASASHEHCKAWGKKAATTLATTSEPQPRLRAEGDSLFVFGYTHELARITLHRVSRAGGKLETIAARKGLGELDGFAFGGGAAYYTQRGSLFKLGPIAGAAIELRKGANSPPTLAQDRVFVVECDKKEPDKLLELPADGGEATLLAELPHSSAKRCQYSSLIADAADVLVADWRGSRVLSVSRRDKSVRELVTKKGFPSVLTLDGDQLVLVGALGLLRVPRAGGDVKKLLDADKVAAPYSGVIVHSNEYWLIDQLAYATTNTLFRMPRDGSAPRAVASYRVADPVGPGEKGDSGLHDFAVDDECIYTAEWRFGQHGSQLVARPK